MDSPKQASETKASSVSSGHLPNRASELFRRAPRSLAIHLLATSVALLTATAIAQQGDGRPQESGSNSLTAARPQLSASNEETKPVELPEIVVISTALDASREQIVPSLGATKHTLTLEQIDALPQADNTPFDQIMYHFPGVAQDELDKRLHVRGEEANLQYRINDVLLPDTLSGFGQELSAKYINRLSLITGPLPAQYGGHTAGIVDVQTKSGADMNGGDVEFYGGSYDTVKPSFEYGGNSGKWTYYASGVFLHDDIGMANPTSSARPLHDYTNQFSLFSNETYVIDSTSRLNFILSADHAEFQLPNTPGQIPAYGYESLTDFNSSLLNENQREQCYYEIASYQKTIDDVSFQLAQFTRYSDVLFLPDVIGDLMFNGVAARADHSLISNGLTGDASWQLNDSHTLRSGLSFTAEQATVGTNNSVFPAVWNGSSWVQTSYEPFSIVDDNTKQAYLYSFYLQDEWKAIDKLTINYGLRFDEYCAYLDENQISPRINAVYEATKETTLHLGYARCFTPPPLEFVPSTGIEKFNNTTYAADPNNTENSPVRSERYHYFDVGATEQILPELQVGLDGYYKIKQYVLDEGQFGPAMIFSPNNADRGFVRGVEFTINYEKDGFSAYGNLSLSRAEAFGLASGQYQFDETEVAYMQNHWYHLDHDQDITACVGSAYKWSNTKASIDVLYGSGLYGGFCNSQELPQYATVNIGLEHTFLLSDRRKLKIRFDITNLFDKVYEIRDGQGIGVFAPQYLPRRGFYSGVEYDF